MPSTFDYLDAGDGHVGDGSAGRSPRAVAPGKGVGDRWWNTSRKPKKQRWRRLLLAELAIHGIWFVIATLSLSNSLIAQVTVACQTGGLSAAMAQLPTFVKQEYPPYLIWALLTPLIFWVGRFSTERMSTTRRKRWGRHVAMHLGVAVVTVVIVGIYKAVAHNLLLHTAADRHPWGEWLATRFYATYSIDLVIYAAILAAGVALTYYRASRERETRTARLEAEQAQLRMQLAQAQFQALRMQINPHFLFNTLNTVSALVERDPDGTRRTVARLSDLLRRALESTEEQEVTLGEELGFVERYLAIERMRFQERLTVAIRVDDDVREALVPNLILQPLVENAVHHGIARSALPGRIEVQAERWGQRLFLRVRDNGPGSGEAPVEGVGLRNTRARLEQLYGTDCRFDARNARGDAAGFVVEIALPFRSAHLPAAPPELQITSK